MGMNPNVCRHQKGDAPDPYLEILDESLGSYGWNPGDVVRLQVGSPPLGGVPVWELDGCLQARVLEIDHAGWVQAYTHYLSGGKICFPLDPRRVARIRLVGWISRQ